MSATWTILYWLRGISVLKSRGKQPWRKPSCHLAGVDGKKKELIEPQGTLFRTDIPRSQYRGGCLIEPEAFYKDGKWRMRKVALKSSQEQSPLVLLQPAVRARP